MGSALTGGSKSSTTPVDMTPEAIKGLRGPFADALKALFGTGTGGGLSGVPSYTGAQAQQDATDLSAPLAGNEQALLDQLMQSGQQGGMGANAQNYLNDVLTGKYLPGQDNSNPYLTAAIEAAQRPTLQALEETLGRVLPGRFTQAGQMTQPQGSSAFDRAAAIATRGTAQSMADIATQLSAANYEGERGRQQEAVGLQQQELDSVIKNLQAQALPRLIQQQGIQNGLEAFQTRLSALLSALQAATGASGLSNISQKSESESQGGLLPALGGFFGGLPIAKR